MAPEHEKLKISDNIKQIKAQNSNMHSKINTYTQKPNYRHEIKNEKNSRMKYVTPLSKRNRKNRESSQVYSENSQLKTLQLQQIDQVIHILGAENFKLFQKGQHATSYQFRVSEFMGRKNFIFIVNIPLEYPKFPLKIRNPFRRAKSVDENHSSENISAVIENFNWKCRELNKPEHPIISQLNYLITQGSMLSAPNFKVLDHLQKEFHGTITIL